MVGGGLAVAEDTGGVDGVGGAVGLRTGSGVLEASAKSAPGVVAVDWAGAVQAAMPTPIHRHVRPSQTLAAG